MTRRTLAALAVAPLAQAKRGPKRGDMWLSPQGQYVLRLRAELERLGYFDDLREDWAAVERALAEGCVCFEVRPSRHLVDEKLLYRVAPVALSAARMEAGHVYDYVSTREWGGR